VVPHTAVIVGSLVVVVEPIVAVVVQHIVLAVVAESK
jgi:hypothetical protein